MSGILPSNTGSIIMQEVGNNVIGAGMGALCGYIAARAFTKINPMTGLLYGAIYYPIHRYTEMALVAILGNPQTSTEKFGLAVLSNGIASAATYGVFALAGKPILFSTAVILTATSIISGAIVTLFMIVIAALVASCCNGRRIC